MTNLPPRRIDQLLARALPPGDVGVSIRGDLREEYSERRDRQSKIAADTWYVWTAVVLLFRYRSQSVAEQSNQTPGKGHLAMDQALMSFKHTVRRLSRNPLFVASSVISIGVALGTATALFTLVKGVLFTPLPYPESSELVTIETNTGGTGWYGSSAAEFLDFESQLTELESVAAYVYQTVTVGDSTNPELILVTISTHQLLPLLGVSPLMGRWFDASEDQPGASPTMLISEGMWLERFGADPDILGKTVDFGGRSVSIIGVMPASFGFPNNEIQAYLPLQLDRAQPNRTNHNYTVVGRLAEGETITGLNAAVEALAARSREEYPQNYSERGYRTRVMGMLDNVVGPSRAPLLASLGAATLLLIMGVVNVATLVVARAEKRRGEVALRRAIGASPLKAQMEIILEGVSVALLGGALGIGLTGAATRILLATAPESIPRLDSVSMEWPIILLGTVLTAIASVALGLLPLRAASTIADRDAISSDSNRASATATTARLRNGLVTLQIGLSASLAMGAVLMMRTTSNLTSLDPGVRTDGILTMRLSPPFNVYQSPEQRVQLWERIVEQARSVAGVSDVAAAAWLPFDGPTSQWSFVLEGRPVQNIGQAPDASVQQTTPEYARTMGLTVLEGRFYDDTDGAESTPVAVVNETMAKRFWPGESAIGKRFRLYSSDRPFLEVIGVVNDVRHDGLSAPVQPRYYHPHTQGSSANYFTGVYMTLVARVDGDPSSVAGPLREVIREVDPRIPISDVRPLGDLLSDSIDRQTFTLLLLSTFASVAVLLAAIGVFGTMTYMASLRRREFGVRIALGASRRQMVALAMRGTAVITTGGILIAAVITVAAGRSLESLLYGMEWFDAPTAAAVVLLIVITSLAAGYLPARSAASTSPMETLRTD